MQLKAAALEFAFLLPRLLRGVTQMEVKYSSNGIFLLPRLLRGVTRSGTNKFAVAKISTPTPLARRDYPNYTLSQTNNHFYSHASCEARR